LSTVPQSTARLRAIDLGGTDNCPYDAASLAATLFFLNSHHESDRSRWERWKHLNLASA